MLLNKRYEPKCLDDIIVDIPMAQRLKSMASYGDLSAPLLFYGQDSIGKRTKVIALLAEIYGSDVFKMKTYTEHTDKKDIIYVQSPVHIELNCKTYGLSDKHIITEFIKPLCSSIDIHNNRPKIF